MKTLITTLAVLTLAFSAAIAKDGTFTSVIIRDGDPALQLRLSAHEWIKVLNFSQNDFPATAMIPAEPAGIAVFKGETGLWVQFATNPNEHAPHEDVFIAGPAIVIISPPTKDTHHPTGATVFLTYQRGSD